MEKIVISDGDQYLFGQGTHYDIYKKLGAHPSEENGVKGTFFAVWAPQAAAVYVVGNFNDWQEGITPMERIGEIGIYTAFVPGLGTGELYKYLIITRDGRRLYKADPYGNYAEVRPATASITTDLSDFKWTDASWCKKREKQDVYTMPLAIYECEIGSWKKHPDGTEDGFYNYRQFADSMVEYLKEMKYTHVELMGIAEYPYDGSWGYQVTGYYAPTSRFGTPQDFMYMINEFHKNGIGVILDWVPAHFTRDAHGLGEFDGACEYEYPDPRMGEHPDWGTKIFNYGKPEVKNFLIANALFWLKEFHVDGLRVDAVASMLYLDYGKQDGQWVPNIYGGNKNLEAIEFFKHLNSMIRGTYPWFLTIAEESTAWPMVTGKVEDDGLGFTYKWNMGWMHDFCEYMKMDPYFRKDNHYTMTFAMSYNDSENYILPLSHDEVVHLKCSMVEKMPGYKVDKYSNLRAAYTFMFGHSGKKLLFMGQDFAQEREWSEKRELDWYILQEPLNNGVHEYMKELLEIYRKYPCMYDCDNSWSGFEWMNADDKDHSTFSFMRRVVSRTDAKNHKKRLLFVINLTPMTWEEYRLPLPENKKYKLLLSSTDERFGGNGEEVPRELVPEKEPCHFKDYSVSFTLPPYAALIYEF
ncbi:MAG: 1,4-alpha-glucan branching protein GlgB [Lachnospiraceae bacterium]|nr:1,4-alpha-glucan branching protein GlgB [Lachnospiraceae bacterium]